MTPWAWWRARTDATEAKAVAAVDALFEPLFDWAEYEDGLPTAAEVERAFRCQQRLLHKRSTQ